MIVIEKNTTDYLLFYPESLDLNDGGQYLYPCAYYTKQSAITSMRENEKQYNTKSKYVFVGRFPRGKSELTKEEIIKAKRMLKLEKLLQHERL